MTVRSKKQAMGYGPDLNLTPELEVGFVAGKTIKQRRYAYRRYNGRA